MRRWVVVVWMLVGFLGQDYVYASHTHPPTRIERDLEEGTGMLSAWWLDRWT